MSQRKKQGFVEGAAILTASTILIKILGAVFKIPLSNIIGKSAMGDFGVAYNIYALLLTLSTAGLPVAMASDFNPGTSPSGNMQLIMSMACIRYRLTPEEALNATTLNTAYAMGVSDEVGSITRGKFANLIITQPMTQLEFMPYYYGANKVAKMILNGKFV